MSARPEPDRSVPHGVTRVAWMGPTLVACVVGCAGPKPNTAVVAAPVASAQVVAPPSSAQEETPSAPTSLVAVGRIRQPAGVWDSIAHEAGVHGRLSDAFAPFGEDVDLRASVHAAWTVRLRVFRMQLESGVVLSASVPSPQRLLDRARAADLKLEEPRENIYRIARGRGDVCVLDATHERAAAIACGDDVPDMLSLARYMTSALPQEDLGDAEAVVEVRVGALAKRLGDLSAFEGFVTDAFEDASRRRLPHLAVPLRPLLPALSAEALAFVGDTSAVRLEARLPSPDFVELHAKVFQSGRSSFVTQLMAVQAAQATTAPNTFWSLAAHADTAWFSAPVNEERYARIRATSTDALAGQIGRIASPRETADLIVRALLPHGGVAHGRGVVPAGPVLDGPSYIRERAVSFFGWHVVEVPYPAADVVKDLEAGKVAYNDGRLRDLVYGAVPPLCSGLPNIQRRPAATQWPPKSTVFEMRIPASFFEQCTHRPAVPGAPPVAPLTIVVALVPHGSRSWVGVSADEAVLLDRMKKISAGAAPALGLLAPLAQEPCVVGGYVGIESVWEALGHVGRRNWRPAPHGATSGSSGRAAFWLSASESPRNNVSLTLRVPRAELRAWSDAAHAAAGQSWLYRY